MDINEKNHILKKPDLPQANSNGIIDVSKAENDFLLVIINHFDTEKPNEKICVFVGDIKSGPYFIEHYPPPYNIPITIPFSEIPDGDYKVTYTVTDVANCASSEPEYVKIINSPSINNKGYYPNAMIITQPSTTQDLDYKFKVSDHLLDSGSDSEFVSQFPRTAFSGAYFTLAPTGNPDENTLFDWFSNYPSRISVDNIGMVTIKKPIFWMCRASDGTLKFDNYAIITAKLDGEPDFIFKFNTYKWFEYKGCGTSGLFRPDKGKKFTYPFDLDLIDTNGVRAPSNIPIRRYGCLLGEWGSLSNYPSWISTDKNSYAWMNMDNINDVTLVPISLLSGEVLPFDANPVLECNILLTNPFGIVDDCEDCP